MASKAAEGLAITRKYAVYGAGAGLIPILPVEMAATIGVQVKMIAELAKLYGVSFDEARTKVLVIGLIGGFTAFSHGVPGYVASQFRWLGPIGVLLKPVYATVVTYAIGNVFITHFEMGGTLANFNPADPSVTQAMREGVKAAPKGALAAQPA